LADADGLAATDRVTVQALLDKGLAVRDDEVLDVENSVGTLVPFIMHFSPETRIVPLILHSRRFLQEIDRLLDAIAPCLKEDAVVVASVDFSHYLTRQEARTGMSSPCRR
jgi:AmmeMemoRadiSam system protein B